MDQKFFRTPWAVSGDKNSIPTAAPGDGSISYASGWGPDYAKDRGTDPTAKSIARADMNGVLSDITTALQQYQTTGAPEFITAADNGGVAFPYEFLAEVRWRPDTLTPWGLYVSLVSNNTALPSDTTKWATLDPRAKLDVTGGTVGTNPIAPVVNAPTLRVVDGNNTGLVGGLSVESYAPVLQMIDRSTAGAGTSYRWKVDQGAMSLGSDNATQNGAYTDFFYLDGRSQSAAIGGVVNNNAQLYVRGAMGSISSGTTQYGLRCEPTFSVNATALAYAGAFVPNLPASLTLTSMCAVQAGSPVLGSGSVATNYYAFNADNPASVNAGGTLAIAYRGRFNTRTGAWNLYMDGTAPNYLNGNLQIGSATPTGAADKLQVTGSIWTSGVFKIDTPTGQDGRIQWYSGGGIRWGMRKTSAAETGANVGSNWVLERYDDAGNLINNALSFNRQTGTATVHNGLVVAAQSGVPANIIADALTGQDAYFGHRINGQIRWAITANSIDSSHLRFNRYNASGAFVDNPLSIDAGTGSVVIGANGGIFQGKITFQGANYPNGVRAEMYGIPTNVAGFVFGQAAVGAGAAPALYFVNGNGTNVGQVSVGDSSTAYLTSSDYRLKQNYKPIVGALASLRRMRMYNGEFIEAPGALVDYAIAHELQEVYAPAVHGEKDATNDDGSIKPQGVDYSKLVPRMIAAMQEMADQLDAALARIAELEGAN